MNQFDFENVPDVFSLDDEDVLYLSIVRAWLAVFPTKLHSYAKLNPRHLHRYMESKEISPYGLLSGAYIGFAPLPSNYSRFIIKAEKHNKLEPNPEEFRKDKVLREKSAADDFGMKRGELKRLLKHLDALASKCADIPSYDAIINCKEEILQDQSPFAPADREAYAEGPLHLWDFAKAVNKHKLVDMCFGTFNDWILFLHLEEGVVSGHAIHARAHRFGNFNPNPLIDVSELCMRGDSLSPIIRVPKEVQEPLRAMADRRFPNHLFEFVPPPMVFEGTVIPSKLLEPDLRRRWAEA